MDKMELIKKVMHELMCEMEEGPEDFDTRLGKKKPKVEIEVMELEPKKMGENFAMDEGSDSDEEDVGAMDSLSNRIAEMKRKKRG